MKNGAQMRCLLVYTLYTKSAKVCIIIKYFIPQNGYT